MATIEFWIGKSGTAKTATAIKLLNDELTQNGFMSARYILPTVGTKLEIERRYFDTAKNTLLNDPINIFYAFTQEVARREIENKTPISDITRHLLLKKIVKETELDFFKNSSKFNGFIDELSLIIDELKVQMVDSVTLKSASEKINEKEHKSYAKKLKELATLYENYQNMLISHDFYDREGLMWIAAETIKKDKSVLKGLNTVIFDGFSRLTPIQIHFIKVLVRNIKRIILIFDYDQDGKYTKYTPETDTMEDIEKYFEELGVPVKKRYFEEQKKKESNLDILKDNIFKNSPASADVDDQSVKIIESPYSLAEAEEIAVTIKELLSSKKYNLGDIACVARNISELHNTYYNTFSRYELPLESPKKPIISTNSGKIVHNFISLKLMGVRAEHLFKLLKSAAFDFTYEDICVIEEDMKRTKKARSNNDFKEKIISHYDIEKIKNEEVKNVALDILTAVNAINEENYSTEIENFMDEYIKSKTTNSTDIKVCATISETLSTLSNSGNKIGLGNLRNCLEIFCDILSKETIDIKEHNATIPFLNMNSIGGQKFKVVFIVNMQHGALPSFTAESPILMDYERDENLKNKTGLSITMRKDQEKDEMSLFCRAINCATDELYLSFFTGDIDGERMEVSDYVHEIKKILPKTYENRGRYTFEDVALNFKNSATIEDFVERSILNFGTHTAEKADFLKDTFPEYFEVFCEALQDRTEKLQQIVDSEYTKHYAEKAYSATELECYISCEYKWFLRHALDVQPLKYDFTILERGTIVHDVLKETFEHFKNKSENSSLKLADFDLDDILTFSVNVLQQELPNYLPSGGDDEYFYKIAFEELKGQTEKFITREYKLSDVVKTHATAFEHKFKDVSIGHVKVKGVIDRIDIADDDPKTAIIVDYKINKTPKNSDVTNIRKLQGLLYILALQKTGEFSNILGCSFLSVNKEDIKFLKDDAQKYYESVYDKTFKYFNAEEWKELLTKCEDKIEKLYQEITAGKIQRTGKEKKECGSCEYLNLCQEN